MTATYQEPPSGGGGVTTYQGLTDAQDYAISEALKEVRVNAAGGGLLFGRPKYYINYFGAVNDGQEVSDGSISSGTNVLNSAEGLFASSDVGKPIIITGAGASGAQLTTTITGYTSATQVTLTVAASSTVSNTQVSWGTDNTAAIQLALDTAALARGGRVIVPIGRWLCTGVLDMKRLPDGVVITRSSITFEGEVDGPFEARSGTLNFSPGRFPVAPCLMITNITTDFLSLNCLNAVVKNLMFYHPNQIRVNSTGNFISTTTVPVVYPFTVYTTTLSGGNRFQGCTFANSYNAVRCFGSRTNFDGLVIGVLNIGFEVNYVQDFNRFSNIYFGPQYDILGGFGSAYSQMQLWKLSNPTSWNFIFYRADAVIMSNITGFCAYGGIKMLQSVQGASYGEGSNIHFDTCVYGIWAEKTFNNSIGWRFSNFSAGGYGAAGYYLYTPSSGSTLNVRINGGQLWGTWLTGKVSHNKGSVVISNVAGYNAVGSITAPSIPASATNYTIATPHTVRVNIYGGTVTDISIGGVSTGLTSGSFVFYPDEIIKLTYSAAPTWTWFGL